MRKSYVFLTFQNVQLFRIYLLLLSKLISFFHCEQEKILLRSKHCKLLITLSMLSSQVSSVQLSGCVGDVNNEIEDGDEDVEELGIERVALVLFTIRLILELTFWNKSKVLIKLWNFQLNDKDFSQSVLQCWGKVNFVFSCQWYFEQIPTLASTLYLCPMHMHFVWWIYYSTSSKLYTTPLFFILSLLSLFITFIFIRFLTMKLGFFGTKPGTSANYSTIVTSCNP